MKIASGKIGEFHPICLPNPGLTDAVGNTAVDQHPVFGHLIDITLRVPLFCRVKPELGASSLRAEASVHGLRAIDIGYSNLMPAYTERVIGSITRIVQGQQAIRNVTNLLTGVNGLNRKFQKKSLPGAVGHPATLISRQHSLSAKNHRNSSSEIINRHQKMAENAEIQ